MHHQPERHGLRAGISSRRIKSASSFGMCPSSSFGTVEHRVHLTQQLQPGSEICVHTTRRSCLSRCCRINFMGLEAAEQPRNVRLGSDHAVADGRTGQPMRCAPRRMRSTLYCVAVMPQVRLILLKGAMQAIGGAHQVQERLLFDA